MNSSNSWRISNMSSCPKLRIEGFTDAWEQRKLSDIVDKAVDNRGKTPPISKEGTHPLIEVASLGNGVPDYAKVTKYLDDESFNTALRDYIKEDDILFSTVGSIGLVSLMDSREDAAIAQNIVSFRAKKNYDAKYIYAMFSTSDNQDKAWRIAMNGVQPSIKVSQLINVLYCVSNNFDEQKQIGEFFINLDNLITLHQRKSDALKNAKKYFLKNMFPSEGEKFPKLRLEGFTDAWEQRKLEEICDFERGQGLSWSDIDDSDGQNECILYGNLYTDYDTVIEKVKHKTNIKGTVRSKKFDVLIPGSDTTPTGLARALCVVNDGVILGGDINILHPHVDVEGRFLAFALNNRKKELIKRIKGTTVRHLQNKDLFDVVINIPKSKEQEKIAELLLSFDHLITLHQRKCDALKNAKKFFLQNMFV